MHRTDLDRERRRRRLLALCPLLFILLVSLACSPASLGMIDVEPEYNVVAPSDTASVGQSVTLKLIRITNPDDFDYDNMDAGTHEDPSAWEWTIDPEEGATCVSGVFTATAPGVYNIGIKLAGEQARMKPAFITVVDKPAALEYDNHNSNAVQNNGTPPTFEVTEPATIATIETYHWNNGTGSAETGEISLQAEDGTVYGPWETEGTDGQGGVPNAYWTARPTLELPEGSYTVLDSDPGTWAQNAGSGGKGMVRIYTVPEE